MRGYKNLTDHPEVVDTLYKTKLYAKKLKSLAVTDDEIKTQSKKSLWHLVDVIYSLIIMLLSLLFSLPGIIMNLPIRIILSYLSEK